MDARQRLAELQVESRQRRLTADEWREVSRLLSSLGQDAESRQAWAKADRAAARERIAALTAPSHESTVAELYELAGLHRQLGDEAAAKLAEETATAKRSEDIASGRVKPQPPAAPAWPIVGLLLFAPIFVGFCMWISRDPVTSRADSTATPEPPAAVETHPIGTVIIEQVGYDEATTTLRRIVDDGYGELQKIATSLRGWVRVTANGSSKGILVELKTPTAVTEDDAIATCTLVEYGLRDLPLSYTLDVAVESGPGHIYGTVTYLYTEDGRLAY